VFGGGLATSGSSLPFRFGRGGRGRFRRRFGFRRLWFGLRRGLWRFGCQPQFVLLATLFSLLAPNACLVAHRRLPFWECLSPYDPAPRAGNPPCAGSPHRATLPPLTLRPRTDAPRREPTRVWARAIVDLTLRVRHSSRGA